MKALSSFAAVCLSALVLAGCGGSDDAPAQPQVIAHRGASGYLPEHTLGGYELAIRMGADFIEPDLQITKDGALVAIHDDTLNRTTNVATLFAQRNGGYKVSDFTLAEIKTLTVMPTGTGKASYPGFTPSSANAFAVPTFQEVVDLAKKQSSTAGREVGIYPEAKQADPAMEDGILKTLAANGYNANSKVFIQSFSDATLRSLRTKQVAQNNKMPLILLGVATTAADGTARMGVTGATGVQALTLKDVATFTEGVGVLINNTTYPVTKSFIDQAHAAGLKVHGWTFAQADAAPAAVEFRKYLDMGMDGMFANYPDLAVTARNAYVQGK
ncbi:MULTISPECIES: glycerophosphodiester phosphodiesterase family protein [unclassified Acidovorax]|uniref:glycerophosphodiester phosphodiesterase family protein n=1 Tax=unclassified Acidovorax TaxID=2684926 RepID=UPI000C1A5AB1|nr:MULTISPECIES: glycerophosphodiester phosphodiesterase family protein [unclassified Acidovorax]PIF20355.1 glycerophosphoryl diester phosphodiesterase [Acidovorax sp. 59]PKW00621.1 glycerophosphoryl diester phosphodiesterase [Acidovorax sp. 30]